ncbi:GGDEF domain-containing protein [Rheinheimera sp.]|uniref:GGDEF domain-containing protein n=1 Tax=Rheinheimera sp. TaxID=1869214 RepID=UPI00307D2FDF
MHAAQQLRTSNPVLAEQLVSDLDSKLAFLSAQQQHHLLYLKAYLKAIKGQLDEAVDLMLPLTSSPFPAERIRANLLLANIQETLKDYEAAYGYLFNSLQLVGRIDDQELLTNIYTVAVQLHVSAGAYQRAAQFVDNLQRYAVDSRQKCIAQVLNIHVQLKLGDFKDLAIEEKARTACQNANERLMSASLALYLSEHRLKTGQSSSPVELTALLSELEHIGFPPAILQARFLLAQVHIQQNRPLDAEQLLLMVQQQAHQLKDLDIGNKSLLLLAKLYQSEGKVAQSLMAYQEYSQVQQAYFDDYKARNIAYHQAQTNLLESENTLALLKNQNELLRLEREVQTNEKLVAIFAGMALVTLLLLALYVVNGKRRALHRLATTDYLTHLLNRRHFTEQVTSQLHNRRQAEQQSLIMLDIDHFKQLNDQYGHASGDYVLRQVAKLCQSVLRKQDVIARMGGEEFAVFLPGCDLDHALKLAEACRCHIAGRKFSLKGDKVQVTASFGVAAAVPGQSFDQLLQQADEALYMAKAAGRNSCQSFAMEPGYEI